MSPKQGVPLVQAEQVRAELERILSSPQFRNSRRCQNLLRHITEHTVAGDAHVLKERTLGIEVFQRPPDYDTNQEPVVRATAAEIRKRLAQYYQNPGHEAEPRIELVAGSYVPEFHFNGARPAQAAPRRRILPVALVGAAVLLGLVLMAALLALRSQHSVVERFWQPMLQAPGTMLICLGQPVGYAMVSPEAQDRLQFGAAGAPPSPGSSGESIPMNELILLRDRFVALGDTVCLVRLAALFEKYGKPYHIRGEGSTSFSDLRENSAVLIGAFNNPWTLRVTGQLRFTFVKDDVHETDLVRDSLHPEKTDWKLIGAWPNWDTAYDYAILTRVLDVNTDRPVVIAAGITQYGTLAAGEFLTNPDYFAEAASQFPSGWQKKNLQIVLRVPVVHRTSGRPHVLATHTW